MAEINPIELLQEEIKSDETYIKVNAIHRVRTLATVMGPEATRSQLIPYLGSLVNHDEDEVLFALAEELGNLSTYIAGSPSILITYLESLAGMEETVVRNQAVKSLRLLTDQLSDSDVSSLMATMVLKLASSDIFSARVSACGLFSAVYSRSGGAKDRLRQRFLELCSEESPIVRRAAASQIGDFCKILEKSVLVSAVIPVFRQLCQDEQDQVRILCLDSLIQIARLLTKEDNRLHLIPIILSMAEDKSWQVKMHIAKKFPMLEEALGRDIAENSLLQNFLLLLRDNELDVRAATLTSLVKIIPNISKEKIQSHIYPSLQSLVSDTASNVNIRRNAADVMSVIGNTMGNEFTLNHLIPLIMNLLNDDNPEVKLHVLGSIGQICHQVGPNLLNGSLIDIINDLIANSPHWRVRESIVKLSADLGTSVGLDNFVEKLQNLFFYFLTDSVGAVREAGVSKLSTLYDYFGDAWVFEQMLPKMEDVYKQELGYLHRITVIKCIGQLKVSLDTFSDLISQATRDTVPNVRLVLCKTLRACRVQETSLKDVVQKLLSDPDVDVRHFAEVMLGAQLS